MSTRSTTHFVEWRGDEPSAIVYRHQDGYPEGHGADLLKFFDAVKAQTPDTRFGDPTYLAAKLVVWLAGEFSSPGSLDFISVGVTTSDPGDIEYRYIVECGDLGHGRPNVIVESRDGTGLGELQFLLRRRA